MDVDQKHNVKSDLDRTKELLDSLGVLYACEEYSIIFGNTSRGEEFDGFPECDKVEGYNGFYTMFRFDEDGNFLTVGAWE